MLAQPTSRQEDINRWQVYRIAGLAGEVVRIQHRGTHVRASALLKQVPWPLRGILYNGTDTGRHSYARLDACTGLGYDHITHTLTYTQLRVLMHTPCTVVVLYCLHFTFVIHSVVCVSRAKDESTVVRKRLACDQFNKDA